MQRGQAGSIHEQNIWVSLQGHGGASAELNSSAQSRGPSAPLHLVVTGVVVGGLWLQAHGGQIFIFSKRSWTSRFYVTVAGF